MTVMEIFASIGGVTVALLLSCIIVDVIIPKIKQVMHRQSKIRCLCKHEYVCTSKFVYGEESEYRLICRKCGKKKKISIYRGADNEK